MSLYLYAVISATLTSQVQVLDSEYPFEVYQQQFSVKFRDEIEAENAEIMILPLFEGRPFAITSRWDDNEINNLKIRDLLNKHGVKATWYSNSNTVDYLNGADYRHVARDLLVGGHSIGGHTLSHPYLSYINRNRMFKELLGVRIEWESMLDTPVNSFTYSFINYRNDMEGDVVHADIVRLLERAGYYHVAEFKNYMDLLPNELIMSVILPPENATLDQFQEAVQWVLHNDEIQSQYPGISHSMHGWYGTFRSTYGLDELEHRLIYLNEKIPDAWHVNQNEYAAYRKQWRTSSIESIDRVGNEITVVVKRPVLHRLNDAIPLSFAVTGVAPESVVEVRSDSADVELVGPFSWLNSVVVQIHHDRERGLPVSIAHLDNEMNRDQVLNGEGAFSDIAAVLYHNDDQLMLTLDNKSSHALEAVYITFRLPLAFEEANNVQFFDVLSAATRFETSWSPSSRELDEKYFLGTAYYAAQIDFRQNEIWKRLYLTCDVPTLVDESYPRDFTAVLGPIPPDQFNAESFLGLMAGFEIPGATWSLKNDALLHWMPKGNGVIDQSFLDFEVVMTGGDWYQNQTGVYLLYTMIESPVAQSVEIMLNREDVAHCYLNGMPVTDTRGRLRAGVNHLVWSYHHEPFIGMPRHAACFLRLADPESQARVRNIKYIMPEL